MSGLTDVQQKRIEESKKKALALRDARQAQQKQNVKILQPHLQRHHANITSSSHNVQHHPINHTNSPASSLSHTSTEVLPFGAKFCATPKTATSGNSVSFYKDSTSGSVLKPKSRTSSRPLKSAYSVSATEKALPWKQSKEKAGPDCSQTYGTNPGRLKGKCVLISRTRFEVNIGYSSTLIEVFKSMNTKHYGKYCQFMLSNILLL